MKSNGKRPRGDGFYTVYIRVTHQRKSSYIKTNKIIDPAHITSNGELTDPVVNEYCAIIIRQYTDKLNRVDATFWELKDVIEFLHKNDEETCFSDYARKFISKMESEGHERNAKNYKLAVNHLERYIGTTKIMFSILTTSVLTQWIDTLYKTSRAKEMYPTCIRQIFKKAIIELNDEERGILRIKYNPWLKIIIPKSDNTLKRAISAEACREFFNRPLPQSKMVSPLPELGRDIALLSLCMGGINTIDLYELKKKDYKNGIIGYKRAKTKHSRRDEAYMEIRIEPFIQKRKSERSTFWRKFRGEYTWWHFLGKNPLQSKRLMEKILYSEKEKSIAFTGHWIIPLVRQEEVRVRLTAAVAFACKSGMTRFYCGMALGFDMMAAAVVLSLKDKFPNIRLTSSRSQDKVANGLLLNRNVIAKFLPRQTRMSC
ncbi:phage integrase SAM-like domain-containing protein [uncultured Phocaeicola sp.]|uniref:phage integrase SAM-like domain-containing protein n=1 Tax=uncultured Phocaeicola sp. TaxID=990718 RepID=UPI0026386BA0|nr:phage integrase SAM-like domain-containing protein [uncultured Phocaeicola sp.]